MILVFSFWLISLCMTVSGSIHLYKWPSLFLCVIHSRLMKWQATDFNLQGKRKQAKLAFRQPFSLSVLSSTSSHSQKNIPKCQWIHSLADQLSWNHSPALSGYVVNRERWDRDLSCLQCPQPRRQTGWRGRRSYMRTGLKYIYYEFCLTDMWVKANAVFSTNLSLLFQKIGFIFQIMLTFQVVVLKNYWPKLPTMARQDNNHLHRVSHNRKSDKEHRANKLPPARRIPGGAKRKEETPACNMSCQGPRNICTGISLCESDAHATRKDTGSDRIWVQANECQRQQETNPTLP